MQRLRVEGFAISVDGYGAGPNQSLENPLGVGGTSLHEWLVHTRTFARMSGDDGGSTGVGRGLRGARHGERWQLDPRPQHVCSEPWPMARRLVARMVG
jgi:hypothetical protein